MRSPTEFRRIIVPLGSLALFLATVEALIPKPGPFFRLGLSNLPLLLGLPVISFPGYMILAGLKILSQALMSGTLFSPMVLLSIAGTLGSSLTMYLLYKGLSPWIGGPGISLAGAFVSNLIQVFLAGALFIGPAAEYLLVPILLVGTVTSFLLGWWAQSFWSESLWLQTRQ